MPTMHCNTFDHELRVSIESRDTPVRPELREHALSCARCRPAWEQHVLLERAVQAWKDHLPAVELTDRIMAHWAFESGEDPSGRLVDGRIRSGGSPARLDARAERPAAVAPAAVDLAPRKLPGRVALAAAVAALLVLLSPLLWRAPNAKQAGAPNLAGQRQQPSPESVPQRPSDRPQPGPDGLRTVRLDAAVREAGSAWMGLANEATGTVRELAVFLPERAVAAAVPASDSRTLPPDHGWTDRFRDDLAPIGRDVGKAMDFLRDVVSLPDQAL
jgi:hypothetical protein